MNFALREIIAIQQLRECAQDIEQAIENTNTAISHAERAGDTDRAERLRNIRKQLGNEHRSITGKD